MTYDPNNIFARILRNEIPCQKVFENDHVLAFHDIQPKAPTHILVIPKAAYLCADDFYAHGSDTEIVAYQRSIATIVIDLGLEKNGYRLITNTGTHGGQEVPHFHTHILGGHVIGPLVVAIHQ
jgi:histidine triad (HIT) family protein